MSAATLPIPDFSLIVPVFNEAEVIGEVLWELREFLSQRAMDLELLVIDDGSSDATGGVASRLLAQWPQARLLTLARNLGQAAALYYGMQHARGRILILMDGDGQNDPWDIPALLTALRDANADMAVGVRVPRRDAWPRRAASRLANAVRRRLLNDGVTATGCGLKAFHCRVLDAFIPVQTLY
ncbi:MAG: glycosyltransferase family 2 protein, partial [Verrucomicrobia bacterium]|nr:glycosyltransferase family 2 protein [Verrucomicrobiota bacterium]